MSRREALAQIGSGCGSSTSRSKLQEPHIVRAGGGDHSWFPGGGEKLDGWKPNLNGRWLPRAPNDRGYQSRRFLLRENFSPPVSPVGFRDPRPRCCPSVTRVLCVRMRFVPRSGLSPRLTNVNVSVGSTTCSLLQTGADKKKSGRAAAARRPITPPPCICRCCWTTNTEC